LAPLPPKKRLQSLDFPLREAIIVLDGLTLSFQI
jgi:hypothetical protein